MKGNNRVLQDEDKPDKWAHVKNYPVRTNKVKINKILIPNKIIGTKKTYIRIPGPFL